MALRSGVTIRRPQRGASAPEPPAFPYGIQCIIAQKGENNKAGRLVFARPRPEIQGDLRVGEGSGSLPGGTRGRESLKSNRTNARGGNIYNDAPALINLIELIMAI